MEKLPAKSVREKLSQWESKLAPLSDSQKVVVMELSAVASQRPLPEGLSSRHEKLQPVSAPNIDSRMLNIKNTQDLFAWFDEMDSEMLTDQDGVYNDYSSHLKLYCKQCEQMLNQLSTALDALEDMTDKHQFVSLKTQSLHDACEKLVEEQNELTHIAEGISNRLAYFSELEQLGQKLNSSSMSLSTETFPVLLARLDECIAFIECHPHYKESPVYLARYRQQLSRALASVKQQVTQTLKSTTFSVLPQQQQAQSPTRVVSENTYSQYYGKFRSCAPKIKALMKEIEKRIEKSPEYSNLLHDCLQCYMSQRSILLSPSITSSLIQFTKQHSTDYCSLVRSCCNFLSRVCIDEYQLYTHFFSETSNELNSLIEGLCYQMYDILRPVVIHVNHMEILTDLCTILKVEIIDEIVEPKGDQLSVFSVVIKTLLGDIQQRLVFRAQRFIATDIRGYKPSPGDLAYPDKLVVAAEAQASTSHGTDTFSDTDSVFDTSGNESEPTTPSSISSSYSLGHVRRRGKDRGTKELHAMWYPTVRRTLMCFSKLYRCLERPVFEGLAQEALSECVVSLENAADLIKAKKGQIDASLFHIKHLLILREQIAAFNVNFSIKEVYLDFTKTRTAAYNLLKKRSRIFSLNSNNSFLEFIFEGFPELIETQLDSKKEVDLHLKKACELFISHVSNTLTHPLKTLIHKFDVVLELCQKEGHDPAKMIQSQPFANAKNVHVVLSETNKLLKSEVPQVKRRLALYLSNEETEHILFRPIRANLLNDYVNMENLSQKYYSTEDQQIISCLTQQEVMLLLSAPAAPLFKTQVQE